MVRIWSLWSHRCLKQASKIGSRFIGFSSERVFELKNCVVRSRWVLGQKVSGVGGVSFGFGDLGFAILSLGAWRLGFERRWVYLRDVEGVRPVRSIRVRSLGLV